MKGIGGTRISSSRQSAKLPKVLTNKVPLIPLALTCIKPRSPAVGSNLSADGPNSARMRTIGVASDGEERVLCLSDLLNDFWLRNFSKETTPSSSSFISGHIILMTLSYPWKCSPTSTSSPWMERMDTIFGLFLLESLEALPSRWLLALLASLSVWLVTRPLEDLLSCAPTIDQPSVSGADDTLARPEVWDVDCDELGRDCDTSLGLWFSMVGCKPSFHCGDPSELVLEWDLESITSGDWQPLSDTIPVSR